MQRDELITTAIAAAAFAVAALLSPAMGRAETGQSRLVTLASQSGGFYVGGEKSQPTDD